MYAISERLKSFLLVFVLLILVVPGHCFYHIPRLTHISSVTGFIFGYQIGNIILALSFQDCLLYLHSVDFQNLLVPGICHLLQDIIAYSDYYNKGSLLCT